MSLVFCIANNVSVIVSKDKNSYMKHCAFSLCFLIPSKFAFKRIRSTLLVVRAMALLAVEELLSYDAPV